MKVAWILLGILWALILPTGHVFIEGIVYRRWCMICRLKGVE
jgi:hypothetical protein